MTHGFIIGKRNCEIKGKFFFEHNFFLLTSNVIFSATDGQNIPFFAVATQDRAIVGTNLSGVAGRGRTGRLERLARFAFSLKS